MGDIGKFIRNLRKERGISQKKLASISEVSTAVLSRIENGDLKINAQSLNKILRVFGYEVGGVKISTEEETASDVYYFEDEEVIS